MTANDVLTQHFMAQRLRFLESQGEASLLLRKVLTTFSTGEIDALELHNLSESYKRLSDDLERLSIYTALIDTIVKETK